MPETIPGTLSGQHHPPEHLAPVCSRDPAAASVSARVELYKYRIERHDHVGQIVIHHAEHDSAVRADERQRAECRDLPMKLLMMPVSSQQRHPRERAQQEAHAHRQHDEHIEKTLPLRCGGRAMTVGHRIADHKADERRRRAPARCDRRKMGRYVPDTGQVIKRKCAGDGVGEGKPDHDHRAGRR